MTKEARKGNSMRSLSESQFEKEVALTHKGTTVYHAYKDDCADMRMEYWFAMSPETGADTFDVRELPIQCIMLAQPEQANIRATLKLAIEDGILSAPA